jgi:hypothetical protein
MDSVSQLAAKLRPYWLRDAGGGSTVINNYITEDSGGGGGGGAVDLSWVVPQSRLLTAGDGLAGGGDLSADRVFTVDATVVRTSRQVIAGAGLTGGGTFAADRTFNVASANAGIVVNANDIALTVPATSGLSIGGSGLVMGTPSAVSATSTNSVSASTHTHDVTWLSTTGATTTLLGVTAGVFSIVQGTFSTKVRTPLVDAAAALRLSPATHLELDPGSNLVNLLPDKVLQSENYSSQTTGMRISYLGEGDFRYLYTDELHAKAFIADLEQALAGGQIISKSVAILDIDFTAPAAGGSANLYVKSLPSATGMDVFEAGDYIRIRNFSRAGGGLSITDCWGTVSGTPVYSTNPDTGEDVQRWTFTRSLAPNAGAMATSTVVEAGAIILDYGVAGNGYYEVNAIDGIYSLNSPYMQIVTFSGHPHSTKTVRLRAGNLRGIFGVTDEYGLYAGGGVTDADAYLRLSSNAARLNNIPLEIWSGGTQKVALRDTGQLDLSFTNAATIAERDFTVHSAGYVRIGRTGVNQPNIIWSNSTGDLSLMMNATPVIILGGSGTSYFAGRMVIGTAGEIIQGTGTPGTATAGGEPWGTFTGVRLTNIGGMGYFATYSGGNIQTSTDSTGRVTFGQSSGFLDRGGVTMWSGTYDVGSPDTGPIAGAPGSSSPGMGYKFRHPSQNHIVAGMRAVANLLTPYAGMYLDFYTSTTATATTALRLWKDYAYFNGQVEAGDSAPHGFVALAGGSPGTYTPYRFKTGGVDVQGTGMLGSPDNYVALAVGGQFQLLLRNDASDSYLRLGYNNSNSTNAYIYFHADGAAPTAYSARVYRTTGTNGSFSLNNTGTGTFAFKQDDGAYPYTWQQGSTEIMRIHTNGKVGIGTNAPGALLDVDGFVQGLTFYADGDGGSVAGTTAMTNATATAAGAGVGSLKMNGATNRTNTIWLKFYSGTTTYYVPGFSLI